MVEVVRWVPVGSRWLGHRPEPLLRERLWGCNDPLPDDVLARAEFWSEAGYDAGGQPVARRDVSRHGGPEEIEWVEREADGSLVVHLAEGGTTRTTFDDAGRAVSMVWRDEQGETETETYWYDEAGRLVAIDEMEELTDTQLSTERLFGTGGRLTVEHDALGVARIVGADGDPIWERLDRPFDEVLAEAAARLAAKCTAALAEAVDRAGLPSGTQAYAALLVYVDQGSLEPRLNVGLEEDRLSYGSGEDGAINTLYIYSGADLELIEVFDDSDTGSLLRDASYAQPDDPYRVVLGAVARQLSEAELPGLTKTADFVAYVAAIDEGLAEKVVSIRLHNPPEAVARWEQGWGGQVLPFAVD